VGGEGVRPLTLRDADLAHLPRTVVRVHEHAGTGATYAGVLLCDILALAGVPLGEQLRLVIPAEQRHARWVRHVVALSVRRTP
jgi:hypothetical protein